MQRSDGKKPLVISESCLRILQFFSEPRGRGGCKPTAVSCVAELSRVRVTLLPPPKKKENWRIPVRVTHPERKTFLCMTGSFLNPSAHAEELWRQNSSFFLDLLCSFRRSIFKTFLASCKVCNVRCDIFRTLHRVTFPKLNTCELFSYLRRSLTLGHQQIFITQCCGCL